MKNDRTNVLVNHDGLFGDAPGTAVVTVEVDGRKLQMPRSLLMDMATFAGNRAAEKAEEQRAILSDAKRTQLARDNALSDIEWLKAFEQHCQQVADFTRSDK